ncbi:hypothetical protein LSCM1_05584 [Leishmania martiniquensis]|uniref:Uncharacterized protein n=1 Tax=Leishmania martiniquensis TaxID=1580590 RepID=A0A836GUG8_9TRYP|nr:hypothetical protein LSCM1_05584 [Leishmania martiniquensis]
MYGGYYGMGSGMPPRGDFGVGPLMHQQQCQHPQQQLYGQQEPPSHMQVCLRSAGRGVSPSLPSPAVVGGRGRSIAGGAGRGPLNRSPSFMMMYNQSNFGPPNPLMQRMGSFHSMGSVGGGMPLFDSFGAHGGGGQYPRHGSFSSVGSGAGSLHRAPSGVNFDYSTDPQVHRGGPLLRNNSYGSMRQAGGSFFGGGTALGSGDPPPQQLSRPSSALGSYSYGSFRQPSFTQSSIHNGAAGVGPGMSLNSMGGMFKHADSRGSSACGPPATDAARGGIEAKGAAGAPPEPPEWGLARQDSAKSLQRSYSIAGQFYDYGNAHGGGSGDLPAASPQPQHRLSQFMPGGSSGFGGWTMGGVVSVNALTAAVGHGGGVGAMTQQRQHQLMLQQQARMRMAGSATAGPDAPPSMRTSENARSADSRPQALGRRSSQNLTRKSSEKRVGMYFKNKAVELEGLQYKKDGDLGTSGKNNLCGRDPSLITTMRASILLDVSGGRSPAVEVDGRTILAEKPGAEEVQKYDMHDIMYVNRRTDIQLSSDSLEEMRDHFVCGCNVGMIMADAGCPAARPTEWFTWLALKSLVKGAFGKLAAVQFEFNVSMCLLQDDQVMDLLCDPPQRFVTLTVAESPLFGNVANGMVYVCVEDAGEFNDVLDVSLQRAQEHCSPSAEEQGIVLCTCVLKQVRTSQSTGKEDVIVSSIFASGVGDGVIHYNRIIDKNPAEPRALFYSVMHRSVHSTALFSCAMNDEEIFNYLATLQRFSKIETRRPKVGSARAFVAYGTCTIPKIREDLEKAKDGRQRTLMQRQLEKLELMVADAEDMLRSPVDSVPKTYI